MGCTRPPTRPVRMVRASPALDAWDADGRRCINLGYQRPPGTALREPAGSGYKPGPAADATSPNNVLTWDGNRSADRRGTLLSRHALPTLATTPPRVACYRRECRHLRGAPLYSNPPANAVRDGPIAHVRPRTYTFHYTEHHHP